MIRTSLVFLQSIVGICPTKVCNICISFVSISVKTWSKVVSKYWTKNPWLIYLAIRKIRVKVLGCKYTCFEMDQTKKVWKKKFLILFTFNYRSISVILQVIKIACYFSNIGLYKFTYFVLMCISVYLYVINLASIPVGHYRWTLSVITFVITIGCQLTC